MWKLILVLLSLTILYGEYGAALKEKIEKPKYIKDEYNNTHHPDGEAVLVPISLAHAGDGVKFNFFSHNREHSLMLVKSKAVDFTKLPISLLGANTTEEEKLKNELKDVELMSDTKHLSSLAFNRKTNRFMHGGFQIGDKDFKISGNPENSSEVHVVRQSKPTSPNLDHAKLLQLKSKIKREVNMDADLIRRERDIEITRIDANVELVVICDYALYSEFHTGSYTSQYSDDATLSLVYYVAHLVTMMDAHYATMMNDDIHISVELSGLIILTDNQKLSTLTEDKLINANYMYIDFQSTLENFSDWLTTEEAVNLLPRHDHTMLLTGYDLYDVSESSGSTIGVAWSGKICSHNESNSIIELRAGLLTTDASTAAHELGHSLGAPHDDASCGPDDNYVMTALTGTKTDLRNRFLFSCCSQRSFYGVMRNQTCFLSDDSEFNNSTIRQHTAGYLPGEVFNADDQCYIRFGTRACGSWVYGRTQSMFCEDLWCVNPDDANYCIHEYTAPADGTDCSVISTQQRWCIHGRCQAKSSNNSQLTSASCDVSSCSSAEFKCRNGLNVHRPNMLYCIPDDWLCDGEVDCSDGSDEIGCGGGCQTTDWMCSSGSNIHDENKAGCVERARLCDGTRDCSDRSDEAYCTNDFGERCYMCANRTACVVSTSECRTHCTQDSYCEQGVGDFNTACGSYVHSSLFCTTILAGILLLLRPMW